MLAQSNQEFQNPLQGELNFTSARGGKQFTAASVRVCDITSDTDICETPCSNTGSKSQPNNNNTSSVPSKGFGSWEPWQPAYEPWVDYLQGTGSCTYSQLKDLTQLLASLCVDRYIPRLCTGYYIGNRRYLHSFSSLLGVIINWEPKIDDSELGYQNHSEEINPLHFLDETFVCFHISVPGKPLNAMGSKNAISFLASLRESYGFSCSRIDCKVRNHSWVVNFDMLESATTRGDIVGADRYVQYESGSVKSNFQKRQSFPQSQLELGKTFTFGSPKSDKRITFYDAKPVHGIDAIDIEVRFRKKLAKVAFHQVLGTSEQNYNYGESLRAIQSIVAGAIDFVHRIEGETNIKRCERYAFWQQFRDDVGGAIRVSRPKVQFSIVKQKQWIETKVFRALAVSKEVMGSAHFHRWIEDVCKKGKSALTSTHDAQIDLYKRLGLHKVKFIPYRNADMSDILSMQT